MCQTHAGRKRTLSCRAFWLCHCIWSNISKCTVYKQQLWTQVSTPAHNGSSELSHYIGLDGNTRLHNDSFYLSLDLAIPVILPKREPEFKLKLALTPGPNPSPKPKPSSKLTLATCKALQIHKMCNTIYKLRKFINIAYVPVTCIYLTGIGPPPQCCQIETSFSG